MEEQRTTPTIEQKYDPEKLENIKRLLKAQFDSGKPQSFEIFVDGLRVVSRSVSPDNFDSYKSYVHPSTRHITVTVYRGIKTPNCVNHTFFVEAEKPVEKPIEKPLNGIDETRLNELFEMRDLKYRIKELEKEVLEKSEKLKEAEEYIGTLQNEIESRSREIGELKTKTGERWIKFAENPPIWMQQLVAGQMNGKALSGTERKDLEDEKSEGEVSFKRKNNSDEPSLSDSQKRHLQVIGLMEQELDADQLNTLMKINDALIEDKAKIPEVADLLDLREG